MARTVKGKTAQQAHDEIRQQNIAWGGAIILTILFLIVLVAGTS